MAKRMGLAALLGIAMLVAGCAEERPARSFVQPNAIKKDDLKGTFYYMQTITETPPTNGAVFRGESSSMMKVRFDIQEDFIYARRAFEHVTGSEVDAVQNGDEYKGAPLAAWRIQHFDIIRDFNPTTGEQTNRIIESFERPWYQREFIRVDWSMNLVTDFVGIGMDFFFSNMRIQPVTYWESDPSKPDGLHIEHVDADTGGFKKGEMTYLDVTNQMIVNPENLTASYEEGGQVRSFTFPKCFFFYQTADCASQRVKVRHSFAKKDPARDVEPRDWDGKQMQMFGIWDINLKRFSFNREYGVTNSGFRRHAARFNIWQKSCRTGNVCEAVDLGPAPIADSTCDAPSQSAADKQCEAFVTTNNVATTATCDMTIRKCVGQRVQFLVDHKPRLVDGQPAIWDASDAAHRQFQPWEPGSDPRDPRLPYSERTLRQIPYYAAGSMPVTYDDTDPQMPTGMQDGIYPPSLYPEFARIVGDWNNAMKGAVKAATGKDAPVDIFVACHNPVRREVRDAAGTVVQAGDPAVCSEGIVPLVDAAGEPVLDKQGQPILRVREGDVRRTTIFWVHEQQDAGPLGYGPSHYDEETGEAISATASIFGASLDMYAVRSRDLILLQNGDLSETDYINGINVQQAVRNDRHGAQGVLDQPTFKEDEVRAAANAMNFEWAHAFTEENGYPEVDPSSHDSIRESMAAREKAIHDRFYSRMVDSRDDKLRRLVGSPIEKMMSTPEMVALGGANPSIDFDSLSEEQKLMASPLRRRAMEDAQERYRNLAEANGICFGAFDEPHIAGQAAAFRKKYGANLLEHADEILNDLRRGIFVGVTLHEVGHNVGMRHNFRGSYDSLNFFPRYWQIRKGALAHPDAGMEPGDNKLHPRYINKPGGVESKWEIEEGIRDYQYSSIMDYGADFNTDLQGLGLYDHAFMKFSYARSVEVFTAMKGSASGASGNSGRVADYETAMKIGSLQEFQAALGFPSALLPGYGLSAIPYTTYPEMFKDDSIENMYQRATVRFHQIHDAQVAPTAEYRSTVNALAAPVTVKTATVIDDEGKNREYPLVPYYFCSDEFAGNLTCQRFDYGADTYEQARDITSRYKQHYLANNFKRNRATFRTSRGYYGRIYGRFLVPLRGALTWYTLLRGELEKSIFQIGEVFNGVTLPGGPTTAETAHTEAARFFWDERGWGSFTAAVALGFDEIGRIITRPDAGVFYKMSDATGRQQWKMFRDDISGPKEFTALGDNGGAQMRTIGLNDGRFIDTTWDSETCGYYWAEECQTRIGYFVDKTLALDILSESQAYFTGRDTNVDVRRYAIGYYLPFKRQLIEMLGSVLAEDNRSLAPYFVDDADGNPVVVNPGWLFPDSTLNKADPIDPSTGFTLSLYTGAYALAAFATTFDHDLLENSKIFVLGNGEGVISDDEIQNNSTAHPAGLKGRVATDGPTCSVDADCDAITGVAGDLRCDTTLATAKCVGKKEWFMVRDEYSDRIWVAHYTEPSAIDIPDVTLPSSTVSNDFRRKSVPMRSDIGVRMLERLYDLTKARAAAKALLDTDTSKFSKVVNAENELQKYRQSIQVMRSLHNAFGYGPFRTDAPFIY